MLFTAQGGDPSRPSSDEYTDPGTLGSNDSTVFSSKKHCLMCDLILGKQAMGERGVYLLCR